ncbi:hypothetical protein [Aeromonas salmonicida]|uniref:hypothetical protein n=1 Tax=Aeromonas salmonicida TaxID=645 RepID=UPI00285E5982|nr:hypothetical protein [Aeromonas salmonicida]MDR7018306.1 hypothetical protein [Aeromonas salmonicida]
MAKPVKVEESALTLIKVTRPFKNYSPGDITGFDDARAQALIEGGVAVLYSPTEGGAAAEGKE